MSTIALSSAALPAPTFDAAQAGQAASSAAELAKRGNIHKTAVGFEASFLSSMYQTMFKSVTTSAPFGGGEGEDMWKSFLAEEMAKQTAKRGGIGIAKSVEREMLKLQGLTETPQ
jgi:Rod binding domain-containing protein